MMIAIGIDLGGTRLRAARVEGERVLARCRRRVGEDTSPDRVAGLVAEAVAAVGAPGAPIGIGLAGFVAGDSGVVDTAPNLGWRDVPFADLVEQRVGRRPRIENDLNAIAWGEYRFGAGRGAHTLLAVFPGTGLGAGLVTGGRPFVGATGVGLELGHVKVDPEGGRPCGCGLSGCLETYVGGKQLPKDPDWDMVGRMLGLGLANAVTLFNPDRLVLGGGVWGASPRMREVALSTMRALGNPPAVRAVTAADAALGDDAGVLGAADLALPGRFVAQATPVAPARPR